MYKKRPLFNIFRVATYGLITLALTRPSEAGLGYYSNLISVKDWVIERKIDVNTNEVKCRASVVRYGSWFSARVRLDRNNNLILPLRYSGISKPSDETLKEVKRSLKACEEGVFFLME